MKPGDVVRMTEALKQELRQNDSQAHVKEFGDCVGIVEGLLNYNRPGESDALKLGPEVDVRWQPSNLRYSYPPRGLELIPWLGGREAPARATQERVEVATLQDVSGKLVQGIGIVVTRVFIDETDHCSSCGITGRGRIAVAFGVGHVDGRTPNPGRCPVICWVCLKAARLVVDGPGVPG